MELSKDIKSTYFDGNESDNVVGILQRHENELILLVRQHLLVNSRGIWRLNRVH
jgi:hypothetical protein